MKRLFQLNHLDSAVGEFAKLGSNIAHLASSDSTVPAELLVIAGTTRIPLRT